MNFELLLDNINTPEESSDTDEDCCSEIELKTTFKTCKTIENKPITYNSNYIIQIATNAIIKDTIAVASNESVHLCKITNNELFIDSDIKLVEEQCIAAKFSPINSNLLYIGCNKSNVKLYDLRSPQKVAATYLDSTVQQSEDTKTFLCFDVSPDDRLVAAGCELFDSDAFIFFWDVRKTNLLGGYWESHTDDVTQLRFHSSDRDKLLSGSTDGLINLYDLAEQTEDDAFKECLNTESSIEHLEWCNDQVYCATHTHDVQFWRLQDATPFADFKRDQLGTSIKKKSGDYSYVGGLLQTDNEKEKDVMLVIGSNAKTGDCLRSLSVKNNKLQPVYNFEGNKQRVRSINYLKTENLLLTGGELGTINLWKLNA